MNSFKLDDYIVEKEILKEGMLPTWNNEFMKRNGILDILEDKELNDGEKIKKIDDIVMHTVGVLNKVVLAIMVYGYEFKNMSREDSIKSILAYNIDKEEFYVMNYYKDKKEYVYVNRATLEIIASECILGRK